jgi:ribulose-phosphate 3-epimerase
MGAFGAGPISTDRMRSGMPLRTAKLAASILSADFAHLADQVKEVESDLDLIHVDNMDAHFVPPLCLGAVVVASLRRVTDLPLHCHLMVERPIELLRDFAEAGADIVSMHMECDDEPERAVKEAAAQGLRAGLAVSPQTPVESVFPFLEDLDRILVMSVRPGWSGQSFLESALPKIESARSEIDRRGLSVEIEVDGGINSETGARCLAAGATVLTAASSIFKAPDMREAAHRLAQMAKGVSD